MQRAVLALLILDANRVVSMPQSIYGLWGDEAPARASGTVQAYGPGGRVAGRVVGRRGDGSR
jgi:hypothetical protein